MAMKGQETIGFNIRTFVKLIIFLSVLSLLLFSLLKYQSAAQRSIDINRVETSGEDAPFDRICPNQITPQEEIVCTGRLS